MLDLPCLLPEPGGFAMEPDDDDARMDVDVDVDEVEMPVKRFKVGGSMGFGDSN